MQGYKERLQTKGYTGAPFTLNLQVLVMVSRNKVLVKNRALIS